LRSYFGGPSLANATRIVWVAESIVQHGVTSKDPALVATVLAQREAFNVHHTTVGRILSAVEDSAG